MEIKTHSLRSKLLKNIAVVALVGVTVLSVLLPYSFYLRDKKVVELEARDRAQLIRTGILSTMMATGEPTDVRAAVDSFMEIQYFKFRMIRSKYVRNQFGDREGEIPRDQVEEDVLNKKLKDYSNLTGTTFRYVSPFISDERCQKCHEDLNGDPIPIGTVMGVSEFIFDVTEKRYQSFKMISMIMVENLLLIIVLVFTIYRILTLNVLVPLKMITDNIAKLQKDEFNLEFPKENSTTEIDILIGQVEETAKVLEEKKKARDEELKEERKKIEQIRSFALKQADHLGITDENEITDIMKRLAGAVKEVEKSEMLSRVTEYVVVEHKEMAFMNDIELIRPAAVYLTDLIGGKDSTVKKGSIELALEEAITNAMIHGNLEVSSKLKEEDYSKFDELVKQRAKVPPYSVRKIDILYNYGHGVATFKITDQGPGFDWKSMVNKEIGADFLPHGRGIIIMRTFASKIEYNDKGNEVTLTFKI